MHNDIKTEYFLTNIKEKLNKMTKQEIIDNIIDILIRHNLLDNDEILSLLHISKNGYISKMGDDLISQINRIDKILLKDVEYYYDDSSEIFFENDEDYKLLKETFVLINYLHENNDDKLAAFLLKKIYDIDFELYVYDQYGGESYDIWTRKINDIVHNFDFKYDEEMFCKILLNKGIEEDKISYLNVAININHNLNLKKTIESCNVNNSYLIFKKYLYFFMAHYDSFNYFKDEIITQIIHYVNDKKFTYQFVEDFYLQNENLLVDLIDDIDKKIDLTIEIDDLLNHLEDENQKRELLEKAILRYPSNKKYYLEYYKLSEGLLGFLVFYNLYENENLFLNNLKKDDKKYLDFHVLSLEFISDIKLAVEIVYDSFKIEDSFDKIIKNGIIIYKKANKIDDESKHNINIQAINYYLNRVEKTTSKGYDYLISEIKNFIRDTKIEADIFEEIVRRFSNRPALIRKIYLAREQK